VTLSNQIIKHLESFIPFVSLLSQHSDEILTSPIGEGWSVQDMISHIMGWDKNFLETTVIQILNRKPVMLAEHPDVQAFNDESVRYGRTMKPQELLNKAVWQRKELVSNLRLVPVSDYTKHFENNSSFTLETFLQEMFVSHDLHHKKKIEHYLINAQK
jgi:hypothetical protein